MKKIEVYRTLRGAKSALDNGGRFYNIFTDADDGQIEPAELAKVAGVFTDRQKMCLYVDMALTGLKQSEADSVIQAMTPELQLQYRQNRPQHYTPAQANRSGITGTSAIVAGVPQHVDSRTVFQGFIMVPMSTGNVTTLMMIPISDRYDVYEVRDQETEDEFLVAHARGSYQLPETHTVLGGILKEVKGDDSNKPKHSLFLDTIYYVPGHASPPLPDFSRWGKTD